jgi:hypothetical protein
MTNLIKIQIKNQFTGNYVMDSSEGFIYAPAPKRNENKKPGFYL